MVDFDALTRANLRRWQEAKLTRKPLSDSVAKSLIAAKKRYQAVEARTSVISTGIFANIPTSNANGIVTVRNASGGALCTSLVTRQSGSAVSALIMSSIVPNGCTNTCTAGGAGSVVVTGKTYLGCNSAAFLS